MKPSQTTQKPLPSDPIGDALADCYTFLLLKLETEKTGFGQVQLGENVEGQPEELLASPVPERLAG